MKHSVALKIFSLAVDRIVAKGKTEPVEIYELLSLQGLLSPDMQLRRQRFKQAVAAYRAQDFIAASAIFSELIEKFNDSAAVMFNARFNLLKEHALGLG
jgi:hypothetical protein